MFTQDPTFIPDLRVDRFLRDGSFKKNHMTTYTNHIIQSQKK